MSNLPENAAEENEKVKYPGKITQHVLQFVNPEISPEKRFWAKDVYSRHSAKIRVTEISNKNDENADAVNNHHGRTYRVDLCNTGDIFLINHLNYGTAKELTYEYDPTFIKLIRSTWVQGFCTKTHRHTTHRNRPQEVGIFHPSYGY